MPPYCELHVTPPSVEDIRGGPYPPAMQTFSVGQLMLAGNWRPIVRALQVAPLLVVAKTVPLRPTATHLVEMQLIA
jgi:hypothetical protein